MTDEELIEKARIAFVEAWEAERKKIGRGIAPPGTKSRAGIIAALAVFREHTAPTGDERVIRDLVEAIRLTVEYVGIEMLPPIEGWSWYDALVRHAPDVAAGFRRGAPAEPARQDFMPGVKP